MRYLPLIAFMFCQAVRGSDGFIDDAAIKAQFRDGLIRLMEEKRGLSAPELRRELKKEHRAEVKLTDGVSKEQTLPQLYEMAGKSSLIIGHLYLCDSCDEWHTNLAGGVSVSGDGIALTNYHVLQFKNAAVFGAMNASGDVFPISSVIASHRNDDIAVIQLETLKEIPFARLSSGALVGESVSIVSHPDSHFFSFSSGEISRLSIDPKLRTKRIEVTAPFARGSSGSGIFNRRGELVGLASATNAIYYEEDRSEVRNLQMVIHSGVPVQSVSELLSPPSKD